MEGGETMTHNQLTLQANKIAEDNMRINDFAAKETQRHNVAQESENYRHNWETEAIQKTQNTINQFVADENKRHNQQMESIQSRSVDREWFQAVENARHNKVSEQIGIWQASIDAQRVAETARHNKNTEVIDRSRQLSQSRVDSARAANLNADTQYINQTTLPKTIQEWEKVILEPIKVGGQVAEVVINAVGSKALAAF